MAQTTQATAEQSRSSDQILSTKLYVPPVPSDLVDRPRLRETLADGLTRGPVLICAPAGFGKTVTAADWAASSGRPIAWLSLDSADNDPVRFWRHLLASLNPMLSEVAGRLAPLLGPPSPQSFDAIATGLINSLESDGHEVSLVLDDYHYIVSADVHASVTFLLEHRPYNLNLVITSRSDPPLPLSRLRAASQLGELRAADLQFTSEEANEFFGSILGEEEHRTVADLLLDRTEGWVAGLQLASLSLRGHHDVAGFAERFSGSHRYVLDYLTDEVLALQPDHIRRFLLETSVVGRLSGDLCDALTGRDDSQVILEEIERANLFLVPLDEDRTWWRYHHLFADLLRSRLGHEMPDRVHELHVAASRWHESSGRVDDAVHHAAAAGDMESAARLVEEYFDANHLAGGHGTTKRWMSMLPDEMVRSRPRLCLIAAGIALIDRELVVAEEFVDLATETEIADGFVPSVGKEVSIIANLSAAVACTRSHLAQLHGDVENTGVFARQALAAVEEDEWMLGAMASMQLAAAEWLQGRLAEAEAILSSRLPRWLETGQLLMAAWAADWLGEIQRTRGDLSSSLNTFERLLAATESEPNPQASGTAHLGIGIVHYQRGLIEQAEEHALKSVAAWRSIGLTASLASAMAILAWIHYASHDTDGALAAMEEALALEPVPELASFLAPVPVLAARLAIMIGDDAKVSAWAHGIAPGGDAPITNVTEGQHLVGARLELAAGQPEVALEVLGRLSDLATAEGRKENLLEIMAAKSLALSAAGHDQEALDTLTQALRLGHSEGFVRAFVDEGPAMAELLGRLVATGIEDVPLAYLRRVVQGFGDSSDQSSSAVPGLVVQLTDREVEVLLLMAAGKRNREIGDELYLAINTVKHHVTHILDKLGATNRTEAVSRATELGILP